MILIIYFSSRMQPQQLSNFQWIFLDIESYVQLSEAHKIDLLRKDNIFSRLHTRI